VTVLFAIFALNVMQTVLLKFKLTPRNSA